MIIQKTIQIPANTSKEDNFKTLIKLTKGLIYQIDFYFPPGSCGLAGICIFLNEVQIYPINLGEFFIGENNNISFPDTIIVGESPYDLVVLCYNEDTLFSHQIILRIGFESNDDLILRYLPEKIETIVNKIEEKRLEDKRIEREKFFNKRKGETKIKGEVIK